MKTENSTIKYFIKIYGCQYNEWDAARIKYILDKLGFMESNEKQSDIVFVISCAVRKTAVDRVMSKAYHWQKDGKKVIVTGCILKNDQDKFIKKQITIWNNEDQNELKTILEDIAEKNLIIKENIKNDISNLFSESNASSAYLPIITGCNNFCSYCAVPYTRGREISRPIEEIIDDFKKMVKKGYKEIILLGQNVNSYNPDKNIENTKKNNEKPFSILLKTLNKIPGDFVVTFTSNHPKDMSDDIIKSIKDLSKIKKEIHLPVQSGSDKVLKDMNRPYTKKQYLDLVKRIRDIIPEIKISTDTIVGFPTETEEDFQETIDLLRKVNFSTVYNNKYSPRFGTNAFKLGDPIPWKEKERRWRILNDISYYKK